MSNLVKKVKIYKGISINKLMKETGTDFKVIKRLMKGDLIRIDIIVLVRICNYLDCNLNNIIEHDRK